MSSRALSFSSTRPPRGRRAFRVTAIVLAILASLVLLWAGVLAILWGYAWLKLGPDDVPALEDELSALGPAGAGAPADTTTFLVSMTESVDPTVLRPSELIGPVVLLQTGGPREDPAVLSLPEELPVTVDGLGESTLAEVQLEGGTDLLLTTVTDYSELRIDHVVSLSIDALPELVDAVEPLEVCDATGCSPRSGDELRASLRAADDEQLVGLVGEVAQALGERVDGWFAVSSPLAARRAIDVIAAEVFTDVGLRGTGVLEVAGALSTPVQLDADTLPLVVNPESGAIVPLAEPAMVRFQHLRDGTPLLAPGESGGTEQLEADMVSAVEVAVLNGAGIDGLAGRVEVQLESAGFDVVGTGNASTFDRTDTVVNYVADEPTIEFAAVHLAEALGDADLEPLQQRPEFEGEPVDLLVTVGEDRDD